MTDEGFRRVPRRPPGGRNVDVENLRDELLRIGGRASAVAESPRSEFTEGSAAYDVASMAIIRLAALLERAEFADAAATLDESEIAAIRTTRNIASHAGYAAMNDEVFWQAVTHRIPGIVRRLLDELGP